MRVKVTQHHSAGREDVHEGTPEQVRRSLLAAHPFVISRVGYHAPLPAVMAALNSCQAFTVRADTAHGSDLGKNMTPQLVGVYNDALGDQVGSHGEVDRLVAAAAFVAGVQDPSPEEIAAAFATHDDDPEVAALAAAGLEPTEENLRALRGVLAASKPLRKAEPPSPVHLKELHALAPDADAFVQELQRASAADAVFPVSLGGKHSKGTLLSYDPEHHGRLILKPGSGRQNPSAGARQDPASQAVREAAFWAASEQVFGLADLVPECHLVAYDDHPQVAAIRALSFKNYKNGNALRREGSDKPRRALSAFLPDGSLHKWATMDFVLGNVDRHSGNVMFGVGGDAWLIDHGSAFAGSHFDPAHDPRTFTPFYLRVFAPQGFKVMSPEERLKALPRLHADQAFSLGQWLSQLDSAKLEEVLLRYGVDPKPSVHRLRRLQDDCRMMAADLAVNAAWCI